MAPGGNGARPPSIVLLAGEGESSNAVYHALVREFGPLTVIQEPDLSWWFILRRRLRRLGYREVAGQVLFALLVVPILRLRGKDRIATIIQRAGMDVSPIDGPVLNVATVNADEVRSALQEASPAVVVVNGTRIISKDILGCVSAPFVNLHAGITPQYRGVHGGYWALAEGRPDLVGTTVHLVDQGIDTGAILAQATFDVERADSFVTYPYLHVAAGIPPLVECVRDILAGKGPTPRPSLGGEQASRLRSHPTIWGYLGRRIRRSVR